MDPFNLNKYSSVPHGTKLDIYFKELLKWQKSLNLIAPSTIDHAWERHFIDSLQLLPLLPTNRSKVLDLGTGAGFPGMVLAMETHHQVTLVESDRKKVEFLRHIKRITESDVTVIHDRIENIHTNTSHDVVCSRALATLGKLLNYSISFIHEDSEILFLKGENLKEEIALAEENWQFDYQIIHSQTSSGGQIIKIRGVHDKTIRDR